MKEEKIQQLIMMTDLIGSTTIYETLGDTQAKKLLDAHDRILLPIIDEFNGILVKKLGDGILSRFENTIDGINAASKIQSVLMTYNKDKSDEETILVRIGLHFGSLIIDDNDVFGDVVNTAKRLESLGEKYLIILSDMVYNTLDEEIARCVELGEFSVKGKLNPVKCYGYQWSTSDTWLFDRYRTLAAKLTQNQYKFIQEKINKLHSERAIKQGAKLKLQTIPEGATVYIEGRKLNTLTPIDIEYKAGDFSLSIEKEGYKKVNENIFIADGITNNFTVELESSLATIDISVCPYGLHILLNGKRQEAITPCILRDLPPGEYTIELIGEDKSSAPSTIMLHPAEYFVYKPVMLHFGSLAIISKYPDVHFTIHNLNHTGSISTARKKKIYQPTDVYIPNITEVVPLLEGDYKVEPLNDRLPSIDVKITPNDESIIDYDSRICTRALTIKPPEKFDTIDINYLGFKKLHTLYTPVKAEIIVPPAIIEIVLRDKSILKRYYRNLISGDGFIEIENIHRRFDTQKLLRRLALPGHILMLIVFLSLFYYLDLNRWLIASNEGTLKSYSSYLFHPLSIFHREEASKRIAGEEDAFWKSVNAVNEPDSYESYMAFFPNGKYSEPALSILIEQRWDEIYDRNDLEACRSFLLSVQREYSRNSIQNILLSMEKRSYQKFERNPSMQNSIEYLSLFPDGKNHQEVLRVVANVLNQTEVSPKILPVAMLYFQAIPDSCLSPDTKDEIRRVAWDQIKNSGNEAALKRYLRIFPDSPDAKNARKKLLEIWRYRWSKSNADERIHLIEEFAFFLFEQNQVKFLVIGGMLTLILLFVLIL